MVLDTDYIAGFLLDVERPRRLAPILGQLERVNQMGMILVLRNGIQALTRRSDSRLPALATGLCLIGPLWYLYRLW